eukprot:3087900-Rhodomonas_salina.1
MGVEHRLRVRSTARSGNKDRTLQTALSTADSSQQQRTKRRRVLRANRNDVILRTQTQDLATASAIHFDAQVSHQRPEDGAPPHSKSALELNCAHGIPVVWGTPQQLLDPDDPMLDFQMLLHIQTDDYRSIRHMILAGWRPKEARNCGFSLTLNDKTKHWE